MAHSASAPYGVVRTFAEGGFVALVILFALSAVTVVLPPWIPSRSPAALLDWLSEPVALAAGGAYAGGGLKGRAVVLKSALAWFAAGLVLAPVLPMLRGLTGFEPAATVVLVAAGGFAAAFGLAGVLFGITTGRGWASAGLATRWAVGGLVGGCVLVLPSLLPVSSPGGLAPVRPLMHLIASSLAVLVPFWAAGLALARDGRS